MTIKNLILSMALLSIIVLLNRCGTYACLTPPPTLHLVLVDKTGKELITKSNKDSLKISFVDANNAKQFITDLNVYISDSLTFKAHILTYSLVNQSFALKDPVFDLELSDKVVGKINLKTFKHNEKCNGWDDFSEVRFNDKVIERDRTTDIFLFKTE